MSQWAIGGVAIQGFSHIETNVPCQDAFAVEATSDRAILALSDGAGSARLSDLGATAITADVARALSLLSASDLATACRPALVDTVNACLDRLLSEHAEEESATPPLTRADFACTLLAAVVEPGVIRLFHLGDGAASVRHSDKGRENILLSLPENGEYANQTFFVSDDNWDERLRATTFSGRFDAVFLMSDGVTPMALAPGGRAMHEPFIAPVQGYFASNSSEVWASAVGNLLSQEKVKKITGDDKSICWSIRQSTSPN